MRCEGVPQCMGSYPMLDFGAVRPAFDKPPDFLTTDSAGAAAREEIILRSHSAAHKVASNCLERRLAHRHIAFPAPLSRNPNKSSLKVEISDSDVHRLRYAQPTG